MEFPEIIQSIKSFDYISSLTLVAPRKNQITNLAIIQAIQTLSIFNISQIQLYNILRIVHFIKFINFSDFQGYKFDVRSFFCPCKYIPSVTLMYLLQIRDCPLVPCKVIFQMNCHHFVCNIKRRRRPPRLCLFPSSPLTKTFLPLVHILPDSDNSDRNIFEAGQKKEANNSSEIVNNNGF